MIRNTSIVLQSCYVCTLFALKAPLYVVCTMHTCYAIS